MKNDSQMVDDVILVLSPSFDDFHKFLITGSEIWLHIITSSVKVTSSARKGIWLQSAVLVGLYTMSEPKVIKNVI